MSELVQVMTHARRLRAAFKDESLETLLEAKSKLDELVAAREEEEEELRAQERAHIEKLEKLKELLDKEGVDPNELVAAGEPKSTRKRAKRPPKYRIIDAEGNEVLWTGQGRKPKAIQKALDNGKNLDDFLI